jgi:hypothetical protein
MVISFRWEELLNHIESWDAGEMSTVIKLQTLLVEAQLLHHFHCHTTGPIMGQFCFNQQMPERRMATPDRNIVRID